MTACDTAMILFIFIGFTFLFWDSFPDKETRKDDY